MATKIPTVQQAMILVTRHAPNARLSLVSSCLPSSRRWVVGFDSSHKHRRGLRVQNNKGMPSWRPIIASGKGFGSARPETKQPAKQGSKERRLASVDRKNATAVDRAVKLVEGREVGARPVDPREAERGRVEYVKVADWGSGQPGDLGSLRVQSATQTFATGQPFYEQLARRLESLQAAGGLAAAPPKGAPPLPTFDRWAFKPRHYLQFLADMHAVHAALEQALASATAVSAAAAAAGLLGSQRQHSAAAAEASGGEAEVEELLSAARAPQQQLGAALRLFGPERGFDRSQALRADAHILLQLLEQEQQQQGEGRRQGEQAASNSRSLDEGRGLPGPTQGAAAYADYLGSLARQCQAAESGEEVQSCVLRLLAHVYTLHLVHLTSGTRIAAAASDKLRLLERGALSFYRNYPASMGEPLQAFMAAVNYLGEMLTEEQRDALAAELPRAVTKSSQMLAALAQAA